MSKEARRKLSEMLRELNLAGVAAAHEEASFRAEKEGWGFERFLHHLVELEVEQRRQRRLERVLKAAKLPRLRIAPPTPGWPPVASPPAERRREHCAGSHALGEAIARRLALAERRLEPLASRLETLSPLKVLERGYAIVQTEDGRIVKRAIDAPEGASIRVRLHEGRLTALVRESRTD